MEPVCAVCGKPVNPENLNCCPDCGAILCDDHAKDGCPFCEEDA